MNIFEPCFSLPEKGNPYYNTRDNGGYSYAIKGSPCCNGLDVLSNCVGWAYGRFHEICNNSKMNLLSPCNAALFKTYRNEIIKYGSVPKLGACLVWKGGNKGYGHVAIVEQINSDGSIITSESGWGNTVPFTTKVRKPDGNWGQSNAYQFDCFLYQPLEYEVKPTEITFPVIEVRKGSSGEHVKRVQIILKGMGLYDGYIDGICGQLTADSILKYEKQNGLYRDSVFGPKCWNFFLGGD